MAWVGSPSLVTSGIAVGLGIWRCPNSLGEFVDSVCDGPPAGIQRGRLTRGWRSLGPTRLPARTATEGIGAGFGRRRGAQFVGPVAANAVGAGHGVSFGAGQDEQTEPSSGGWMHFGHSRPPNIPQPLSARLRAPQRSQTWNGSGAGAGGTGAQPSNFGETCQPHAGKLGS